METALRLNCYKMDVKNQHYVPQAYLTNFADEDGKVWRYDKVKKFKSDPHIRNVAAENYFYDSETLRRVTGDKQFIEKKLGQLEGDYAGAVKTLLQSIELGQYSGVKDDLRELLSVFMAIQMIRTKEHRILVSEANRHFDALVPGLFTANKTPSAIVDQHLDWLLDGKRIRETAEIFHRHIWVIQRAYGEDVFYTSDNPLARRGHMEIPGSWMSMGGINSPGIEIVFPISSKYLLVLYERNYFRLAERDENRVVPLLCTDNMIYANHFQVGSSTRFVFSRTADFSLVERILIEEPHLGDPGRKRISGS